MYISQRWPLSFDSPAQTNHPQYPQVRWWLENLYCKTGYSYVFAVEITSWLALLYTVDFAFSETFLHFKFPQIFNTSRFCYGNDETRIQSSFIPRWKPSLFGHKGLYGQSDYASPFYFALSRLVQFPSYKQSSWWIFVQ